MLRVCYIFENFMLIIFGGLPGTGKTTLATALAQHCNAVYLRVDTIEQALRDCGNNVDGPQGYVVAYQLASENLRLGHKVIADSVNPIEITRNAWKSVALQAAVSFAQIEVICSDQDEHRRRVESRTSDIPDFVLPDWQQVLERHYEKWEGDVIRIETAGQTPEASFAKLLQTLEIHLSHNKHNSR
jgi:predicted kinase